MQPTSTTISCPTPIAFSRRSSAESVSYNLVYDIGTKSIDTGSLSADIV